MHIAVTIALFIIGFAGCYFLSFWIRSVSVKEMREEREEFEQEYQKWLVYMEKAKKRLENPDMEEEHFSVWERFIAFITRINLAPTVEELNEMDWSFLETPVKEPEYSTLKRVGIGLIGAISLGVAGFGYGINLQLFIVIALYLLLIIITFVDIDAQIIPPLFNIAIFILGVAAIWVFPDVTLMNRCVGFVCVSVPMLVIAWIVPGGFGGGDIKLMAAAGFLLGVKAIVVAFFIGLVLGGGYGIIALLLKKKGRKEHFAFGPCLSIGIAIAMYCNLGNILMNLYLGTLAH